MEPRNSSPNTMGPATPEQASASVGIESAPNTLPTPEAPISSPEQARSAEQLAVDRAGHVPLPAAPAPVAGQASVVPQPTTDASAPQAATPATAADGNLIEKEWIEKVKQVISHTADDPHAQQSEISRLVADYVLKRTGRQIGKDGG
jgi:hypothetical protein